MFGDWDHDGRLGMEDFAKTTLVVGMMDDCSFMEDEEEESQQMRRATPQGSDKKGCLKLTLVCIGIFVALCVFFWIIELVVG